jgi:hypothetical protein
MHEGVFRVTQLTCWNDRIEFIANLGCLHLDGVLFQMAYSFGIPGTPASAVLATPCATALVPVFGLTISLMTASETFASFKVLRAAKLVSNLAVDVDRIFSMITSSERPRETIPMISSFENFSVTAVSDGFSSAAKLIRGCIQTIAITMMSEIILWILAVFIISCSLLFSFSDKPILLRSEDCS